MKTIFSILKFGFVGMLILAGIKGCNSLDYVTRKQFVEAHAYLNRRVDTIFYNQEIMKTKIDSILKEMEHLKKNQQIIVYRLDTLQAGQVLIYTELTKQNENEAKNNFFNYVIDFFN